MSIVVDGAGRGYSWRWTDTLRTEQQLVRRLSAGALETLTSSGWAPLRPGASPLRFGQIASVGFAPGSTAIVAEVGGRVLQVSPAGAVRVLAERSALPRNAAAVAGEAYLARLWGVAADAAGTVFVADGGGRQVVRLAEGRPAEALARAPDRYFPVGVALSGNQLYVLEYPDPELRDAPTGPRVRVVALDGRSAARVLGATPPGP
jgi:hypothetical protein